MISILRPLRVTAGGLPGAVQALPAAGHHGPMTDAPIADCPVTPDDVEAAAARIASLVRRTPVIEDGGGSDSSGSGSNSGSGSSGTSGSSGSGSSGSGSTSGGVDDTTTVFPANRDVHGFGDATVVWAGHGAPTTLGAEREHLGEWRARGW